MVAAVIPQQRDALAAVRLRESVLDALLEQAGYRTEGDKAAFLGCDRKSLWRIRQGHTVPNLEVGMTWASKLGVPVEVIWELSKPRPSPPPPQPRPPNQPATPAPAPGPARVNR